MEMENVIDTARKAKGFTQKELGDLIGLSQPQVFRLCSGNLKGLKFETAKKIKDCLEIGLDEIFGEASK